MTFKKLTSFLRNNHDKFLEYYLKRKYNIYKTKMFQCHKCQYAFTSKQSLDYHLNKAKIKCEKKNIMIVDDKKMFKCSECDVM
jgi:NAD kinase